MSFGRFWRSEVDPERVIRANIIHYDNSYSHEREDLLALEEPFEIQLHHESLAMIMRTPGHDLELATGFLFSEGLIQNYQEIRELIPALDRDDLPLANVVNVELHHTASNTESSNPLFARRFAVSSSCGLCGKNSIADVMRVVEPLEQDSLQITSKFCYTLPEQLHAQQEVFGYTGGLHAAALFTLSGQLLVAREDVGRHNAVDKLIGYSLRQGCFPLREHILLVSGRASFEIVQKALLARIPFIVAISAPSSLAVELAEQGGITLIGFLRNQTMNVYTHPQRIKA